MENEVCYMARFIFPVPGTKHDKFEVVFDIFNEIVSVFLWVSYPTMGTALPELVHQEPYLGSNPDAHLAYEFLPRVTIENS